jgi:hypothetical protein
LRLNPDYAQVHSNLGGVLLQAGRVPKVLAHYQAEAQ